MRPRLPELDDRLWFPDPSQARRGQLSGLLALGGDLSVPRLLLAYRSGIFPWTADPITWWSPDPRGIFEFDTFHIGRSLARALRKGSGNHSRSSSSGRRGRCARGFLK
jgi:leucyl/phenylalanyl-tRNA--protein transferase